MGRSFGECFQCFLQELAIIISALAPDSEMLANLQDDFHHMLDARRRDGKRKIEIFCFYEQISMPVVMVLPLNCKCMCIYMGVYNIFKRIAPNNSTIVAKYEVAVSIPIIWVWLSSLDTAPRWGILMAD